MIYSVSLILAVACLFLFYRRHTSRQRELLATTLSSIGDAVMVTDLKGRITFLNPVAEHLTGWSLAEATGRPLPEVFRIVNEDSRLTAENPVEKVFRLGTIVGLANHTILIGKDGRETPIDDSAAPIRDARGKLFGVVLVFRDVTERRRADEARGRLAAIVESAQDPIVSKGLDGIIRTWNAGAERLFGYKAGEIVGKHITTLLPPERLFEEAEIMERLHRGQPDELLDTVRVTKDGRRINVSVRVTPILDSDGRVIGASKIVRDISVHKRLEEEIRRANASLEHRVAERTEELRKTIAELERFTYTVAHDLRAPLRGVHRYSELLLEQNPRLPPAEAEGHLRRIADAAKRMDRLIGDLLTYSRVSQMRTHPETLDLGRMVREAIDTLATEIEARGAEVDISGSFPPALGDRVLLGQVLTNLLSNALKFVPPERTPRIGISARERETTVRLCIRDNGIGIEPRYRHRLFQLFERLHGQDEYPGTGMGLAIVSRAAERMEGRVGFDSEQGRGSCFWIELRRPEEAP